MRTLEEDQWQSRSDNALGHDPEVPAGTSGLLDLQRERFDSPAAGQLPARLAGLRNLNRGLFTDLPDIANADIGLGQAFDREVLPESSIWEPKVV